VTLQKNWQEGGEEKKGVASDPGLGAALARLSARRLGTALKKEGRKEGEEFPRDRVCVLFARTSPTSC